MGCIVHGVAEQDMTEQLSLLMNSTQSGAVFFFLNYSLIFGCWVFVAACGLSLVAVHGLLTAAVSPVAEHSSRALSLQ